MNQHIKAIRYANQVPECRFAAAFPKSLINKDELWRALKRNPHDVNPSAK
jgi:hypothetical protein